MAPLDIINFFVAIWIGFLLANHFNAPIAYEGNNLDASTAVVLTTVVSIDSTEARIRADEIVTNILKENGFPNAKVTKYED